MIYSRHLLTSKEVLKQNKIFLFHTGVPCSELLSNISTIIISSFGKIIAKICLILRPRVVDPGVDYPDPDSISEERKMDPDLTVKINKGPDPTVKKNLAGPDR